MISHCSFDLHFCNNERCRASFHVFVSHLYVFFGKCLFRSFPHFWIGLFVFLVLSSMSCLYILEINPLFHLLLFSHILRLGFSFLSPLQSGFCPYSSTIITLVKFTSDQMQSVRLCPLSLYLFAFVIALSFLKYTHWTSWTPLPLGYWFSSHFTGCSFSHICYSSSLL